MYVTVNGTPLRVLAAHVESIGADPHTYDIVGGQVYRVEGHWYVRFGECQPRRARVQVGVCPIERARAERLYREACAELDG